MIHDMYYKLPNVH